MPQRYSGRINADKLKQISDIIDAGIGITIGEVIMGNVGPKKDEAAGVNKLGILGDPLNLAARIEGLTRHFSTDIIIAEELQKAAESVGFRTRRLGTIRVKGRVVAETLYALGTSDNPYFQTENINQWEHWLLDIEKQGHSTQPCPDCYKKDQKTIHDWLHRNLLGEAGVWYLDKK